MIRDFVSSGLIDIAAEITGSSFSIVPVLATANGRVMPFGRRMLKPN